MDGGTVSIAVLKKRKADRRGRAMWNLVCREQVKFCWALKTTSYTGGYDREGLPRIWSLWGQWSEVRLRDDDGEV